jgi:hypothetical protein
LANKGPAAWSNGEPPTTKGEALFFSRFPERSQAWLAWPRSLDGADKPVIKPMVDFINEFGFVLPKTADERSQVVIKSLTTTNVESAPRSPPSKPSKPTVPVL